MGFAEERQMAELAFDYDGTGQAADYPPVSNRIRAARERLGLSDDEVVRRWGVEPSFYWDLEIANDEIFTCIDIAKLPDLARVLETPLPVLLFGSESPVPLLRTSAAVLARRVTELIESEGISANELSDKVGWELGPLLADPETLGTFNIAGLRDVCKAVGVDWLGVIA